MGGRIFLEVARDMAGGKTEAQWRTAVGRAYYALLLEGRDALGRWGFTVPPRQNLHTFVRLRFTFAADPDLRKIGDALDQLFQWRNQADYHLKTVDLFDAPTNTLQAIALARNALALLDRIDGDPERRSAAIAGIRP
jgi:hypothetical protein